MSDHLYVQQACCPQITKKIELPVFLKINQTHFKGFNGIYEVHVVNLLVTIFGDQRIKYCFQEKGN